MRTGSNVPRPDIQRDLRNLNAAQTHRCRISGVKCKPAVGAATALSPCRINGLIALAVHRFIGALDIGRQRNVTQTLERLSEIRSRDSNRSTRNPYSPRPSTVAPQVRLAENDPLAHGNFSPRPHQRLPRSSASWRTSSTSIGVSRIHCVSDCFLRAAPPAAPPDARKAAPAARAHCSAPSARRPAATSGNSRNCAVLPRARSRDPATAFAKRRARRAGAAQCSPPAVRNRSRSISSLSADLPRLHGLPSHTLLAAAIRYSVAAAPATRASHFAAVLRQTNHCSEPAARALHEGTKLAASSIVISSRGVERLRAGHLWVYRSDVRSRASRARRRRSAHRRARPLSRPRLLQR